MRKIRFKLLAILCAIFVVYSCNDSDLFEETVSDSIELKSTSLEKKAYIVVLKDAELDAELTKLKGYEKKQAAVKTKSAKILARAGILDGELGFVYGTAIIGFSVKIAPGQMKKLQNDPSVKYVEEDFKIALAPPISVNAVSATSTQAIPWGITRVQGGGENLPAGSPKAWIVDSGIDMDHPDLNVNSTLSADFTGSGSPEDAHGHGTHVAGTVAAINNDIGVIGVAPNAEVISCRVLGSDGTGDFSWTLAALDYIATVASPGDVVNMSLGPESRYISQPTDDAVRAVADLGIKVAIAAGNESDDATYYSPARVEHPNVYTVAAMAEGDVWATYSNYGSPVDYIEPGSFVTSTYIDGYATMSGTSMASPHMAGILLLGDFITDGSVTVKKRRYTYSYPIAIVDGGNVTPPVNQAPVADFSFTVSDLTVTFTDGSSDADGTIASWAWDFGDGGTSVVASPSHTYLDYGTFTVSLTVTDDDGATDEYSTDVTVSEEEPPVGGDITITATGSKVRGTRYIDVTWTGATGDDVDIKINGETYATTGNDGSETLNLGRTSGTFVVTVCETDGSACSNEVTVVL